MDTKTFKKRDSCGGAIQGHLYEFKLILLFTLRAIVQNFKFKVASNMEEAGDFDDVVGSFEYTDDEGVTRNKTIFLQAKHVMDPQEKTVSKYELCRNKTRGKFYLEKYFKSYLKIKANESVFTDCNFDCKYPYFIIYTNSVLDLDDKIYFDKVVCDSFLSLLLTNCDNVYKLKKEHYETFKSSIDGKHEDIVDFFDNLILCVSQCNESQLEKKIKNHISERYDEYNSEYLNECFFKASKLMQDWWSAVGVNNFLNHNMDFVHESSVNLSVNKVKYLENQVIKDIHAKGIEYCDSFVNQLVSIFSDEKIVKLKCSKDNLLLGVARVIQAFKQNSMTDYILINEYVLRSLLGYETIINFKNSSKNNKLVITISNLQTFIELELFREIESILISNESKKLIIIFESDVKHIAENEQISILELNNNFVFSDLSQNCRSKILNSEINYHGKNLSVSELFGINVEQAISSDLISSLLLNKNIKVGSNVDYFQNVWNCYIPRKFIHNAHFDIRSLKACKVDVFLILTDRNNIKRSIHFDNNCPSYPSSIHANSNLFVHFDEYNVEEMFCELYTTYADRNAHLLRLNGNNLCWEKTHGSIKTIQELTSKIKNMEQYSEQELVERCSEHRIAIISDIAGMGKTIVLKGIAHIIAKKYPYLWIGIIDLNSNVSNVTSKDLNDFNSLKSFLLSVMTFVDETEKNVFLSMLEVGKVALIFDGFDEIKTNMENKFVTVITSLLSIAISQIYITCRTNKQLHLEQIFNVLSYRFVELSEYDQSSFLAKQWSQTQLGIGKDIYFLEHLASLLLRKFNSLKIKDDIAICGIPLQLRIIAEIYQSPDNEVTSVIDDNTFDKSLTDIYNNFFKTKIKITNDRGLFCSQFSLPVKDVRKLHQLLAIRLLFSDEEVVTILSKCEAAQLEAQYTNPFIQMYGIVTNLRHGNVTFAHRTFAEYLAAEIILIKALESTDQKFQKLFVDNILMNAEHKVLRIFMNDILSNNSTVKFHKDSEYKLWEKNWWFQHNLGCTPLHVAACENNCNILNMFLEFNKFDKKYFNALINSKDNDHKTALHVAAQGGHLNIVKLLFENKSSLNNNDKFGNTVLVSAALSGNWILFNWLCSNNEQLEKSSKNLNMLLSMARFSGNLQAVNWLVKNGADAESTESEQDTALHESVRSGNLELITWYIKNGANVNEKNGKGNTILFEAIHLNLWNVAKYLIDNSADVHAFNSSGFCNLHEIVLSGNEELIRYVLSKGVNVDILDESGNSTLHIALTYECWKIADILIESGANCNLYSAYGDNVLHYAVKLGNYHLVSKCLENISDINAENKYGYTCIRLALMLRKWEIAYILMYSKCDITNELHESFSYSCEMLFLNWMVDTVQKLENKNNSNDIVVRMTFIDWLKSHHLNVNSINVEGFTFLQTLSRCQEFSTCKYWFKNSDENLTNCNHECYHLSKTFPNIKILSWLHNNGLNINAKNKTGNSALHIASQNGNLILVRWLLHHGGNVICKNTKDETALHFAAKHGSLNVVARLIEYNAIINAKDLEGNTPLHFAAKYGHIEVVELLIREGADIKLLNNRKESVLHFSVISEDIDVVSLVLNQGCCVNALNSNGDSVLHYAVKYAKVELISWLINKGGSKNARNNAGDTLLYLAFKIPKLNIFRWLLRNGCNVNVANHDGVTDFHKIVRSCDADLLELMINSGGIVNCKTNQGATPLHFAVAFSNLECISCLVKFGASVNAKDNNKCSILHEAVKTGSLSTVKWLIENNADVKAVDKNNSNIVHIAAASYIVQDFCKHDSIDNVLTYILNLNKVNFNAKNASNEMPLNIAERLNYDSITNLLKKTIEQRKKRESNLSRKKRFSQF